MSEIIPIAQDPHGAEITALISLKNSVTITDLAAQPDRIDSLLAEYYRQASQKGLIVLINTAIRALGIEAPAGVFEWQSSNGRNIHCRYNSAAGTTIIAVGGLVVLSNERPEAMILRPGEWMHYLNDAYRTRQREQAWQVEVEAQRTNEGKLNDFLADV